MDSGEQARVGGTPPQGQEPGQIPGPPVYGPPGYVPPGYYGPPGYGDPPYGYPPGYRPPIPPGSVPNNLVWAILATILCCLPFGVVAIINAAKVDNLLTAGDYAGAVKASNDAQKWSIISAVSVVALYAVMAIIFAILFAAGVITSQDLDRGYSYP